jgi:hypothetical protein
MITARQVARVASATRFRSDVVEKVLRLHGVLKRLDEHPVTQGEWLLKGGTALNLLYLDVPRLSVDIDLNWVGAEDVDAMRLARPEFERAMAACCEREGLTVRREPSEHAGGKFRLRFASVLGGTQNLEVDVSYVARVPLWGSVRRPVRFPPGSTVEVPTLEIEELAAGKFAALVQRTAARDAFDAARLLDLMPDLVERLVFRTAFLCFVGGSRPDVREVRKRGSLLASRTLARDVEPLLRRGAPPVVPEGVETAAWIEATVVPALDRLLDWTAGERRFLDRLLDHGEIDAAALHEDTAVQQRVLRQPMLVWKAQHVRSHRHRIGRQPGER